VKPLISMLVRVVAVAGVAGLSISAALAFDGPMHGAVLAGINDHGNLVLVLDRYQGPGDAENGEADAVIMFAAADDAPLPEIVQAIRQSESRINLDMRRDSEGAFLHLNIPRSADYILKVDYGLTAPNDRSGSMHRPCAAAGHDRRGAGIEHRPHRSQGLDAARGPRSLPELRTRGATAGLTSAA
jgi:hypothetical protein